MKNFSFKNVMYAIGTSLFLIMLIFTLSTSLINPMYGMSEGAVMERSDSSSSESGTGDIVCHCTWLGKCKTSGSGNTCAKGYGSNINCQDFNGNC